MTENTAKTSIDTRTLLLDTATSLFSQMGFEAVSTRLLARESGVNVAMISYYFGSKEKLFEAIIETHIPRTREMLLTIQNSDLPHWEKMCKAIDSIVERLFSHPGFSRMIHRELTMPQRPAHNEVIIAALQRNWEILHAFIRAGQDAGDFRRDVDAELLLSGMYGALLQLINAPTLMCRFLHAPDEAALYGEPMKERMRHHLKKMIGYSLLPQ